MTDYEAAAVEADADILCMCTRRAVHALLL
jgi:hypothetical protein